MSLAVAERFVSINGEGLEAGRLATFVRFCGCNLQCSYCDTRWACDPAFAGCILSVDEVVDYVVSAGCCCVTLTGGEPLLQPSCEELVDRLVHARTAEGQGFRVELETNGAVSLAELAALRRDNGADEMAGSLVFTMDWKCPSSGMTDRMLVGNLTYLGASDALKFVVGSREDLECMRALVQQYHLAEQTNVLISPVFGQIEPSDIVAYMKEFDLVDAKLQLQLHKFIWPLSQRGV